MDAKKINISEAKPGMVLASDAYSSSEQRVLEKGTALTDKSITRLKFYSVREVEIVLDAEPAQPKEPESLKQENVLSYTKRLKKTPEYKVFAKSFKNTVDVLEVRLKSFINGNNNIDTKELVSLTKNTFDSVGSGSQILDMLICIRNLDDLTFVHGTNVSLLCGAFAQWLGYSKEDTEQLILAGLLHDIGKLEIPDSILKKKGALTKEEYDIIKGHAKIGYELLKNQGLDKRVLMAVLQHHERTDGSGYPDGTVGTGIDEFAKIVAICDVYDAMTAARCYRGPICPLEVLNMFETEGLTKYDPKYLFIFMERVVSAYLHQYVLLNDGSVGEIIMINKHAPARPIVKLLDSDCLDLSKDIEKSIVGLV